MRKRPVIITIILVALLISACTSTPNNPTVNTSISSTLGKIFTDPTAPSTAAPTEPATQPTPGSVDLGSIGIGLGTEAAKDQNGSYLVYEGGEMMIPLNVRTGGIIAQKGIGVLLFVDGQPQPYKTEEEPEYAYLHILYPEPGSRVYNFSFTPVTGVKGDDLEVYLATILYPTYSLSEGVAGMVYTSGSNALGFRLKYEQTPPEDTFPEKLPWLSELSVSFQDTTAADTRGWNTEDLRERIDHAFRVNGTNDRKKRRVYGVSADAPLSLCYELWGSPYIHFGLVFFVDNIPVWTTDGVPVMLEVQNGKKTIVEADLKLDTFDGESVIYAVLVPRNYRSSEVSTSAFLDCSGTIFLLEESAP